MKKFVWGSSPDADFAVSQNPQPFHASSGYR
jgi:hypothetical protein